MTDDTDQPPSPPEPDNLVHLPVIKVERSPDGKPRKAKAKSAKSASRRGKAKKRPNLSVVHSAEDVTEGDGAGRPTRYKSSFPEHARIACARGATDRELAGLFGVSVSTIYEWRLKHVEFSDAIRTAKELADERVERSLYNRAVGYTFDAEKVFANGFRAEVVEHVPPDVSAAQFWLKNRRPKDWRDVQKVDHTVQIKSAAELLEEIKRDVVELGLLPDGSFGPAD